MTIRIFFALAVLAAPSLFAQTFRGAIGGRVDDPTGAAVPGCALLARNTATGFERAAETTETGDFAIPELPPGEYQVSASCRGFRPVELSRVVVSVGVFSGLRIPVVIQSEQTTIAVTETLEPFEIATSTRTAVVRSEQVESIPLNGRDFLRLLRLSTGVVLQGTSFYAVNGSRGRSNNFQIDGADNNDAWQNASAGNQGGVSAVPNTLIPI
jgi:hypothetical protein